MVHCFNEQHLNQNEKHTRQVRVYENYKNCLFYQNSIYNIIFQLTIAHRDSSRSLKQIIGKKKIKWTFDTSENFVAIEVNDRLINSIACHLPASISPMAIPSITNPPNISHTSVARYNKAHPIAYGMLTPIIEFFRPNQSL